MVDRKKVIDLVLGLCVIAFLILNHNTFDFSKVVGTENVSCDTPGARYSAASLPQLGNMFDGADMSCYKTLYEFSIIPRVSFDKVGGERIFWDVIILGVAFLVRRGLTGSAKVIANE